MPTPAFDLARYGAAVFDLDGTVLLGEHAIPGAVGFVERCRTLGLTITFATNATAWSVTEIATRLAACGLGGEDDAIVTGGSVVAGSLAERGIAEIVAVAPAAMVATITATGITVRDPLDFATATWDAAADRAVVMGAYREATMGALETIGRLHAAGHPLYVTSLDASFPSDGRLEPGGGTLVAAVSAMYPTSPTVLGKPSEAYAAVVARATRTTRPTVMFGDSQRADIGIAHLLGADSVLVTGPNCTPVRVDLPAPTYTTSAVGNEIPPTRHRSRHEP